MKNMRKSNWIIYPNRVESKQELKPPPRNCRKPKGAEGFLRDFLQFCQAWNDMTYAMFNPHQEFQVPKMEGFQITLFSAILGVGFALDKPYPYSLQTWVSPF